MYVANRVKSGNEMIYINIDVISQAIDEGRQIKFRYFDYTVDKKKSTVRVQEFAPPMP